ncbi:MAG TPA: hypothetical protein VFS21_09795, partial [Roseiflexaceae bacterium]|nr:hypothetical protein [Roseiflexaceae bacterium]
QTCQWNKKGRSAEGNAASIKRVACPSPFGIPVLAVYYTPQHMIKDEDTAVARLLSYVLFP